MEKLKPCPFCGNSAYYHISHKYHDHKTRHVIKCTRCNASMEYRSEKAAADAWNRRAGDGNT